MRKATPVITWLAIAAGLLVSHDTAKATVFGQGVVDVTDAGPVTVFWYPLDRLPLDRKIYLRINGGDLLSATWAYSFEHQHLWWEYGDSWGPYLGGNEFLIDGQVSDNQTLDTHAGHTELHYIVQSTLDSHHATLIAHDRSAYYSDCADPYARPPYQDCSTTAWDRHLGLDRFVVQPSGASFSWTLADVPEPTTWALMLTGAGLVGAVLRRRRKAPIACEGHAC